MLRLPGEQNEKSNPARQRVEVEEIILTGRARVVDGVLTSETIVSGAARGTLGTAGAFLLATSSMGDGEVAAQAVAALQDAGLSGVIAPAFAWPFFRICLNLGLPPLTLWEAGEIRRGDRLRVDLNGQVVKNLSSGTRYPIRNLSDLYGAILACGGMAGYIRALRTEC
jgi:3-isopropylmalate dehydratase small subunit